MWHTWEYLRLLLPLRILDCLSSREIKLVWFTQNLLLLKEESNNKSFKAYIVTGQKPSIKYVTADFLKSQLPYGIDGVEKCFGNEAVRLGNRIVRKCYVHGSTAKRVLLIAYIDAIMALNPNQLIS